MKKQYLLLSYLLLILGTCELHSQGNSIAYPEYAIGARSAAMGQSATFSFSDATSVFQNPSSISWAKKITASLFYTNFHTKPLDVTHYSFGVVIPTGQHGSFGVNLFRVSSQIPLFDPNSGQRDNFSYIRNRLLLSYGKNISTKLAIGFNVKFVSGSIFPYSERSPAKTIGLDFGLQHTPGFSNKFFKNLSFGIAIDNLVKPFLQVRQTREYFPRVLRAIVENDYSWGNHSITMVGNLVFPQRTNGAEYYIEDSLHGGLEYCYRNVSFRTGYQRYFQSLYSNTGGSLSYGLGMRLYRVILSYAYARSEHGLTLSYELEKKK